MRFFYVGFNLYGQVKSNDELCVKKFAETGIDWDRLIDIEFNHSSAIFLTEKSVQFNGENASKIHQSKPFSTLENVVSVSMNEDIALFLTENGDIFKVCLETFECSQLPNFLIVENKSIHDKIIKVQCGNTMIIALSKQGHIFNIPNKLHFKNTGIKEISVGREHCLILTENGCVYSFGRGSRGQLGHGDLEDLQEPTLIAALDGIKITKIAAGGWHSAALSCEGDLYMWGWNANGQLGLKPDEGCEEATPVMASPRVIDVEDDQENIEQVACGNRHTVALSENNKLYGAGWNKYYQLGLDYGEDNINRFTFIYNWSKYKVTNIKCGPWATAVMVDDED